MLVIDSTAKEDLCPFLSSWWPYLLLFWGISKFEKYSLSLFFGLDWSLTYRVKSLVLKLLFLLRKISNSPLAMMYTCVGASP